MFGLMRAFRRRLRYRRRWGGLAAAAAEAADSATADLVRREGNRRPRRGGERFPRRPVARAPDEHPAAPPVPRSTAP